MPNSHISSGLREKTLADFTSESLILPQLRERDTPGIIQELSRLLQQNEELSDVLPFYHAVINREYLTSTAMGSGLAFPHARVTGLQRLVFALGRTAEPVTWGTRGALPVRLVFLLAVPATEAAGYLHLLSGLAKISQGDHFLNQLLRAETARELFSLLKQIELRSAVAPGRTFSLRS